MNNSRYLFMKDKWGVLSILILAAFTITFRGLSQEAQTNKTFIPPSQFFNLLTNAPVQGAQTNSVSVPVASANGTPVAEAQPNNTAMNEVYVTNLTGIVIVANSEDVQQAGVSDVQGVVVKGPRFLQRPDFEKLLERHLNAPLTDASSKEMQVEIIKYCRSLGHSVVDVFYREQEIINGTIQIAVVEGKIGKITVANEGAKWFSDALILGDVHLRPGEPIMQKQLDSDISWLNQNTYNSLGTFEGSFRDVQAELTPGDHLGEVNVNLLVKDRIPFRPFVGYDNAGIPVIGRDQIFAGFEWANVLGLDQRLNYQYTTDTEFDRYRAHLASYVIPLPWHHEFTILGAYAEVNPNFGLFGPAYSSLHINNGSLYQISGRYNITLPQLGALKENITAGFDYKHINTPLFFGTGASGLLSGNLVDVAQFTLGYQAFLPDRYGSTVILLQGVYSPGGLTGNNSDAAFESFMANPHAHANYHYGQAEIRRETRLPGGFSWMLRGMGQIADSTLIASESFGVGGYSTVRGYDERTVTGDKGWLVQNELRTPQFAVGNLTHKKNAKDWVQGLIFCDYGGIIQQNPTLGQSPNDQLLSVGAGLRYQVADNLHFRLDYGRQLKRGYLSDPGNLSKQDHGQFDIGVEISY